MKLYDFDGMFEKKLSDYLTKNSDKYKEEEWEELIPKLYEKFGNTVLKTIGKTPNEYYAEFTDEELIKTLSAHLKNGVPVSDFLCMAIEGRNAEQLLLPLLNGSTEEAEYAINLLGSADCALEKYMQMLCDSQSSEDRKNSCVDLLKEKADSVKQVAIKNYSNGVEKEYMLEILSNCKEKSEQIFQILLNEFRCDSENIPMHASYLATYGDDRALSYLLEKIDEDGITFIEFTELKYAIEALGGEYDKERDFSNDPYYAVIKSKTSVFDIFDINKVQ